MKKPPVIRALLLPCPRPIQEKEETEGHLRILPHGSCYPLLYSQALSASTPCRPSPVDTKGSRARAKMKGMGLHHVCILSTFPLFPLQIFSLQCFVHPYLLQEKGKVDRSMANHCAAAVPWCLLFLPPVLFCVPRRAGAGDKRHGQLHYHALYLL